MLIGYSQTFAIECYHDPIPNETSRVFGRMCIHSEGKVLGDISEPACMLNVTEGHLEDVLSRLHMLSDPEISSLSDQYAFELLDRALYLDDDRTIDEIEKDTDKYFRYDFLTNGGESFDGTKSFVTLYGNRVRILFTDKGDQFHSMHAPADMFCKVMSEFFEWLKREGESVPV